MRKLASIQQIVGLRPIPGADAIEVAQILGWEVVVKKGEFKVNDLCVYIEIDSVVPEWEIFEFLRERKFRIKTIRLKKQVSQGIAFPLYAFPIGFHGFLMTHKDLKPSVGTDVTDVLGIKKYDPQAEQEAKITEEYQRRAKNRLDKFLMEYSWWRKLTCKSKVKRAFPKWIHKTDETRLQNTPGILKRNAESWIVTEKLDGQSVTYFLVRKRFLLFFTKYIFGVCSRNFQLLKEDDSSYWTVAKQQSIREKLTYFLEKYDDVKAVVLQGEIIGQRIQGNKYKIDGYDFYGYNLIVHADEVVEFDPSNGKQVVNENFGDLKWVPILDEWFSLKPTVPEMVEYSKGNSVVCKSQIREGVVIRSKNWNAAGEYSDPTSFKVINPDFLLKCEE